MENPSTSRPKGKILHSKEREIIKQVIMCVDQEAKDKELLVPLSKATERACKYANVSKKVIVNIRKKIRNQSASPLTTPRKSAKKPCPARKATIDDFDRDVIRRCIEDFYVNQKIVPSIKKLLPVLKEKINFTWSKETLRKILHEMGFRWKKSRAKRLILVERHDIIEWRCRYLTQVKQLRNEGRQLFYIDETWVDSNLTFSKCWQSSRVQGVLSNHSSSNRLIVVSIGSAKGFLEGASLVFKSGKTTGDYHGQMNAENFEKWIKCIVLPKLPPASAVIIDNAPYHNKQVDKPPTKYSTKKDMVEWLCRHGVPCDIKMRKPVLFSLVENHKPPEKQYRVDVEFQAKGHKLIRLPPYMCDLNPIELAWAKIKNYVRTRNTSGDMSLARLTELTEEAIQNVTASDWEGYCKHVEAKEKVYWDRDIVVEEAIDSVVINLGNADSGSDSGSETIVSDTESEAEGIAGVGDDEEEVLALPLELADSHN